ncbi:glycosyltransferase family 2 protein [Fibrella aquatica]|uniref:glycosyltransferase family 2 protein n=1 Tax=Fibrella aquatica TaxID=3242487 RepID=UPI00352075BA
MELINNKLPLISVIMPTYDAAKTLVLAIESINRQNYSNLELIIIDGNSNDGTVDILKTYETGITFWISEPDKGIYDAMNKGISKATGDWLYFLGADDQLNPDILNQIAPYLDLKLAAVYGDVIYDTGGVMRSRVDFRILIQNTLHHQATFYNRGLFTDFRYNTDYRVISDYELNLQIYLRKKPTLFVPYLIATCGSVGTSSVLSTTEVNDLRGKYVKNRVVNYLLNSMLEFYYFYFKSKKKLMNHLR